MRNRAKCGLCGDIIESFTLLDLVTCGCGEIGVSGGNQKLETFANDYKNFLRVDDDGTISTVQFLNKEEINSRPPETLSKTQLIEMLEHVATGIERMPEHARYQPATNADIYSVVVLLCAILRAQD